MSLNFIQNGQKFCKKLKINVANTAENLTTTFVDLDGLSIYYNNFYLESDISNETTGVISGNVISLGNVEPGCYILKVCFEVTDSTLIECPKNFSANLTYDNCGGTSPVVFSIQHNCIDCSDIQSCLPFANFNVVTPPTSCVYVDPANPTAEEIEACIENYLTANPDAACPFLFPVGTITNSTLPDGSEFVTADYIYQVSCEDASGNRAIAQIEKPNPNMEVVTLPHPDYPSVDCNTLNIHGEDITGQPYTANIPLNRTVIDENGNTIDDNCVLPLDRDLYIRETTDAEGSVNSSISTSFADAIPAGSSDSGVTVPDNNIFLGTTNGAINAGINTIISGIDNTQVDGTANAIFGARNSVNGAGSIVAGSDNQVDGPFSGMGTSLSLVVGRRHQVEAFSSVISGQDHIVNDASYSVITGERNNVTAPSNGNVIGGGDNVISNVNNSIVGNGNTVSGESNVVGGNNNDVSGTTNVVNGTDNNVQGIENIVGGSTNLVESGANIVGGFENNVRGPRNSNLVVGEGHDVETERSIIGGESNTVPAFSTNLLMMAANYNLPAGSINYSILNNVVINAGTAINALPANSADPIGLEGSITFDDDFFYVKTSTGWKRTALTTF